MRRTPAQPVLVALIAITLTSTLYAQSAPRFTARTTDGEKFTNATLKGSVVLLQFWATWCGVCREDQSMVDSINEEFANRGPVVLAVNIGESKRTVKHYLDARPRSCKIVLGEDTNLAAIFPSRGVPDYVLIDRDGKVLAAKGWRWGALVTLQFEQGIPDGSRGDGLRYEENRGSRCRACWPTGWRFGAPYTGA